MRKQTFWTAFALAGKMFAQLLITLAAVTALSKDASGLWFVFMSLGGTLQLFYLGFSSAVLRNASHLHAGCASLLAQGVYTQSQQEAAPNTLGLKNFLSTIGVVYGAIGLLVALLGLLLAHTVLAPFITDAATMAAWGFFVGGFICQLFTSMRFHFMQGIDRLSLAQAVMGGGVLLIFPAAALAGFLTHQLWAICLIFALGSFLHLLAYEFLLRRYRGGQFDWQLLKAHMPNGLRAGVSKLSLSLIYHLPTVLISRLQGLALGGAYGFTVQICFFMATVAQLPIHASLPQINRLAALGDITKLRKLFVQKSGYMVALYALMGIALVLVGPPLLALIGAKTTLLGTGALIAMVFFFFLEAHRTNHVMLVSAFNRFPFWKADALTGVVVLAGAYLILSQLSLGAFIAWMFICGLAVIFWWPIVETLKHLQLRFGSYMLGLIRWS